MQTLVVFDIGDNRLRSKVERACRDVGMERTQYSAFLGELSDERRSRLQGELMALVDGHTEEEDDDQRKQALFIQVFPICAADFARAVTLTRGQVSPAEPETKPDVLIL